MRLLLARLFLTLGIVLLVVFMIDVLAPNLWGNLTSLAELINP